MNRPLSSPQRNLAGPPAAPDDAFTAQLLDFYAKTAAEYDTWDSGVHAKAAGRCAEVAEPAPGTEVLDVGCGTGLVTRALAATAPDGHVVGVDISEAMLLQAQQVVTPAVSLLQMDARDLYLQNEAFDLVTLCQVLSYLVDAPRVLAEIRRVLRPGGRLVVCCQQRSLATPAEQLFFKRLDAFAATGFRIPRPPAHNALFGEPWALAKVLDDAGFDQVRTTNMVLGNHAGSAAAWIDLMRGAGPYPHALISVLGPGLRQQLEAALDLTMRADAEGAFRYHRAFTYMVVARR
ncbi:MAG: methyltransferase domain-containing protein [Chloroflexi bacterium]|nr:methyltransferase domain-containing protein [Chloroflexota bacterium]